MLLLAAAAALAGPAPADVTDLERRVLEALTGTRESGAVVVHFDPATVPASDAGAEAARAREVLAGLEARLETRWEGKVHVFLYADGAEFRARTGAPAAWEGFAKGDASLHVPRGAPLRHELTHLLARRFPVPGSDPPAAAADPGGLLREGLAAAMEGTDRGIPVSSFAAVYARLGLLPPLADLRDRWPEGPPREFHPYHAAGSFVEGLLATGVAKVKALYAAPGRAEAILGRGWDALEGEWRARLAAAPVPDAEEDAVRREFLLPTAKIPAGLAAKAGVPLVADADPLPARWTREEGLLRGEGADSWTLLGADREWRGEFAVRAVVRAGPGAGLLLRVNRSEGRSDEALLTPEGVGVTLRGGLEGLARAAVRLVPGRWTEVVLAQEKGTARLYLDGRLVVEAPGAFGPAGGAAAIGARGGVTPGPFPPLPRLPPTAGGDSLSGVRGPRSRRAGGSRPPPGRTTMKLATVLAFALALPACAAPSYEGGSSTDLKGGGEEWYSGSPTGRKEYGRKGGYAAVGVVQGFEQFDTGGTGLDADDSDLGITLRGGYRNAEGLAVEGCVESLTGYGLDAGIASTELDFAKVGVRGKYYLGKGQAQPYAFVGVGYGWVDTDIPGIDDNGVFVNLGVGVDVYLSMDVGVFLEGGYTRTTGDIKDLDTMDIAGGVIFRF